MRKRLAILAASLLVLTAVLVPSKQVWHPSSAQASGNWSAASISGSGQAPFDTFTSIALGRGVKLGVNLSSGSLLVQTPGLVLPQISGLDLALEPLYNSVSANPGGTRHPVTTDMGTGWLSGTGADIGLVVTTSSATFYDGSGHGWIFNQPSSCSFTAPAGIDAQLTCNGSSGYTLAFNASAATLQFSSGGFLTSESNRAGNTISFVYDANNRLTQIQGPVSPGTQYLNVSYNANNQISQVADPAGRTWSYVYDANDNLSSVTDAEQHVTSFSYDGSHDLTQVTDPNGNLTLISYVTTDGPPPPACDPTKGPCPTPGPTTIPTYQVASITRVTDKSTNTGPTWSFSYGGQPTQSVVTLTSAACYSAPVTGTTTPSLSSTSVTDPNSHVSTYDFDGNGLLRALVYPDNSVETKSWTSDNHPQVDKSPSGAVTAYTYDSKNNLTQLTLPNGACKKAAYTNTSQPYLPSSSTDAQGNTSSYQYNSQGLVTTVTDALNHTTVFSYNSDGTLASKTDQNAHVTTYGYTSLGLLNQVTLPSPLGGSSFTYNSYNLRAGYVDGKAQSTGYSFNRLAELTGIAYAGGSSIAYGYDADGDRTSMVDGTGTTQYTYNALNQQTQKSLPNGHSIIYTWDGVGNLLTKTDGGGTVTYTYTARDKVATVSDPQALQTTLSYDADAFLTGTAFPDGVTETMTYNSAKQLTSIAATNSAHSTLTSFSYSYTNPASQPTSLRTSVTDVSSNKSTYTYDALNRLTQAVQKNRSGATIASYLYAYDAAGNMTSENLNGATTSMSYNAANELSQAGSTTFSFDANGNETGSSAGLSLAYNSQDQATSIMPPGGSAVSMTYTGEGETERVSAGSSSFDYDATGLSTSATGSATTYFTRLPDGTLLAERTSSAKYYYLVDGLGSVAALTDSTGSVVNTYSYDPYGNAVSASVQAANPFRYIGGVYDSTGFYKLGARFDDPTIGRFTQQDPVACSSSTNLFWYANDNPATWSDPTGRYICGPLDNCGGGSGGGRGYPNCGICQQVAGFIIEFGCHWYTGFACAATFVGNPIAGIICAVLLAIICHYAGEISAYEACRIGGYCP